MPHRTASSAHAESPRKSRIVAVTVSVSTNISASFITSPSPSLTSTNVLFNSIAAMELNKTFVEVSDGDGLVMNEALMFVETETVTATIRLFLGDSACADEAVRCGILVDRKLQRRYQT